MATNVPSTDVKTLPAMAEPILCIKDTTSWGAWSACADDMVEACQPSRRMVYLEWVRGASISKKHDDDDVCMVLRCTRRAGRAGNGMAERRSKGWSAARRSDFFHVTGLSHQVRGSEAPILRSSEAPRWHRMRVAPIT